MSAEPLHLALVGDSIFDNDTYVLGEPGVIEQMRRTMPKGWSALKTAVDGHCIGDVAAQVQDLPSHLTDLVVSIGGNDIIGYSHLLSAIADAGELPALLSGPKAEFAALYAQLMDTLASLPMRKTVCTIYTAVPFEEPTFRDYAPLAIASFNEIVLEIANKHKIPVVRLDLICTDREDFSRVSPIEPSAIGGQKIVDAIIGSVQRHC